MGGRRVLANQRVENVRTTNERAIIKGKSESLREGSADPERGGEWDRTTERFHRMSGIAGVILVSDLACREN
jgi:hypothetical protein